MEKKKKAVFAWCMYDWANSAFATTVMTAFFPVFFKSYWNYGVEPTVSTARLGLATGIGGFLVALLSPLLGSVAEAGRAKKKFLAFFMILGVWATALLFFVPMGHWQTAFVLIICAEMGFSCGNLFYDSLLVNVAERREMDMVSTRGYAFGYVGGGLLFALNILMTSKPSGFGLSSAQEAVRASFPIVSVWWFVFALPLILFVHEPGSSGGNIIRIIGKGLKGTGKTALKIVQNRSLGLFLVAYWLYIDGIYTVIFMATDFGLAIGLSAKSLMLSILLVQIVATPASIGFGFLAKKTGTLRAILCGIAAYIVVCIGGAAFLKTSGDFMIIAAVVGMAQGGVQGLSRSYFAQLVPADEAAEYFGFFNLVGKFSAILGPILVGTVAFGMRRAGASSHLASRIAMSSIVVFFISGAILLIIAESKRNPTRGQA
jgi:MFS transporter, UMF1 family